MTVVTNDVSPRQRGRASRSGAQAACAIRYDGNGQPYEAEPVRQLTKNPRKDNYSNPAEFYSGPAKPGKVHGIRRNEAAEKDTVRVILTDEYLMRGAPPATSASLRSGASAVQHNNEARHNRSALSNACEPKKPEPKWHSAVRITHPQQPMDAPYFEDTDPKPAREDPSPVGKRHVQPPARKQSIFIDPSVPLAPSDRPVHHVKSSKSNQSVNVLCLSEYTPQQLNEPRPTARPLGARKFEAPDMPPAPHPAITPIHNAAKSEHDVLGTGRWGTPEEPKPHGVARGSCRPPKDGANLFAGDQRQIQRRNWVPPSEVRKPSAMQRKYGGQPNLLKYYDPAIDIPAKQPSPRPGGNRTNQESKPAMGNTRPGRAPGAYSNNGASSQAGLW